jgi:uncharacterized protein YqgV (UPF0045/DUF77 family)
MIIQAELSLYPLKTGHIGDIIARFAEELRANGLKPETGAMSTIVKGECRTVFSAAERAFEVCGEKTDMVLVLKAGNACPDCAPNKKSVTTGVRGLHYERNLSKNVCHSHENGNPDSEKS